MSQGLELLLLFVVLPFVVAGGVIAFVSWRNGPAPVRTSEILATGDPGTGEVVAMKPMSSFLDGKPMVRVGLRITVGDQAGLELEVVQSIPRGQLRRLAVGDTVRVRVTPDRTHAAIELET